MNKLSEDSNKEISATIYVLRCFAIVCVAAAHCGSFLFPVAEGIRALLGTVGVPVFLICSGYYIKINEPKIVFWEKKLKSIVVPWIVWGIITYFIIVYLGKSSITFEDGIRWVLGYQTWLYYVPVLLICFVLFRVIKSDWWVILNILFSLVSWTLTHYGIIQLNSYVTLYQNAFNFTAFFALGILLKKIDIRRVTNWNLLMRMLLYSVAILCGIIYALIGEISYWGSWLSLPFELLATMSLFLISFSLRKVVLLRNIGRQSYFIYFFHMTIGSGIAGHLIWDRITFTGGAVECVIAFIMPTITVLISYGLCRIIQIVGKKIKLDRLLWIIAA